MRAPDFFERASTAWILLAVPVIAHAEPAVPMSHLPFLWLLAAAISVGLTWAGVKISSRNGRLHSPLRKWVFAIILLLVLLLFVAPALVSVGNMLITGRTM